MDQIKLLWHFKETYLSNSGSQLRWSWPSELIWVNLCWSRSVHMWRGQVEDSNVRLCRNSCFDLFYSFTTADVEGSSEWWPLLFRSMMQSLSVGINGDVAVGSWHNQCVNQPTFKRQSLSLSLQRRADIIIFIFLDYHSCCYGYVHLSDLCCFTPHLQNQTWPTNSWEQMLRFSRLKSIYATVLKCQPLVRPEACVCGGQ